MSACNNGLQITNDRNSDEIHILDIPGGPSAFEIRAKFCYDMTVTLNAYSVVAARCFAKYLGMHEIFEKGNLIHIIGVFFNSSIFHAWKEEILLMLRYAFAFALSFAIDSDEKWKIFSLSTGASNLLMNSSW